MSIPGNHTVQKLETLGTYDFGETAPVLIDRHRINRFAECTGDHQWIHVDEDRAEKENPFGGTIAHGHLMLSLVASAHLDLQIYPPDARQVINYRLGKMRFLAPAPAGSTAHVAVKMISVEVKRPGQLAVTTLNDVRIDGADKPALTAEQIAYVMN